MMTRDLLEEANGEMKRLQKRINKLLKENTCPHTGILYVDRCRQRRTAVERASVEVTDVLKRLRSPRLKE